MRKIFLEAEWRKLAMANYAVDPAVLKRYVPHGTELDFWRKTCYVSLVGFMFINTRLRGIQVPFHSNFEEVNLRFYVRYKSGEEWRRGVVFIKEIVPKPALTFVANFVYNENYETMPMQHEWKSDGNNLDVSYRWRNKSRWNSLSVKALSVPLPIANGSEEEFITEHYWGYTQVSPTKTSEYGVEHPRWNVYKIIEHSIDVDFESVYGKDFRVLTNQKPTSVFLAEGSEIVVRQGGAI
jgi:uncharacterized protein YqjF (DUF2071 family)